MEESVCAVSVSSPVIRSVLARAAVKVERKASISASMRCRRLTCSASRLVLGGHQREILIGARLQARLHDGERFQQAAKFVTPPDRDIIGKLPAATRFSNGTAA